MNRDQRRFAMDQIHAIGYAKTAKLNNERKELRKTARDSSDEIFAQLKAGKLKFKKNLTSVDQYTELRNIFQLDHIKDQSEIDEKAIEARRTKLDAYERKLKTKVMLGSATEEKVTALLEEFEAKEF